VEAARKDFFVSYTSVDEEWAVWIAHALEEAGYSVVVQAWDFRPGSNFVIEMQKALQSSDRLIAVLSTDYLAARYPQAEWAAVFAADPEGASRRLIPVMVQPCQPGGLLGQIVQIRVHGLDDAAAKQKLLGGVRAGRLKPTSPPTFPGTMESTSVATGGGATLWSGPLQSQRTGGGADRVPRQLPRETGGFIGRAAEVERLLAMAPGPQRETAVVISSIDGMAGVGKTALAVYAAHRMAGRFPDGQLFINLHGFTRNVAPVEPAEALDRLLRILGIPGERIPADLDDRAALWRTVLAGQRMLIVLDNAATEAQVEPLLPGEPGSLALVTSRHRLAALEATHTISLDTLPTADAVALFAATIGQPQLATESSIGEVLVEAVELCGRLPLAIRIAAARLQGRPATAVAELVAQLRDEELRPAALSDLAEGGRSVTAALELSYQRLAVGVQRIYRLLGIHPGPELDSYAAAALAGSTLGEARQWLDRLLDAHLLQEPTGGRYGFHDLVRGHAARTAAIADPDSDRQTALDRLLDHYLHTAAAAMDVAYPYERQRRPQVTSGRAVCPDLPNAASALGWLNAELANLLATARYAAQHGPPEYPLHLSRILHRHLRTSGRYDDAETLHRQALTTARATGHHVGELSALSGLGDIHRLRGRFEQAVGCYQEALQIAHSINHPASELDILGGLGHVHRLRGRFEQAVGCYQEALQIAHSINHPAGELDVLGGLGDVHLRQGRHFQATDCYQQALQIARSIDHRAGEQAALSGLGGIYWLQSKFAKAAHCYQLALQIARTTGHQAGELNALAGLGHVHLRKGEHERAAHCYQQALQIARTTGHRGGELMALGGLGLVYMRQGMHEQSTSYYQDLLALAQATGDRNYQFEARQGLGRLQHASGHPDAAIAHHRQALALASDQGQPDDQARAHDGLAHAWQALDRPEQARRHWQHALDILTTLGIDHSEDEQVNAVTIQSHLADLDPQREPPS
jgi:tetratricopeptide (TPR) repeat protein